MTDGHFSGYQEMLSKVDWNKYGVVDGVARDTRCENCMVHCGYDPSGALGTIISAAITGRISNTTSELGLNPIMRAVR